jgi:glucose/arabinose dehydrogenase
VTSSPGDRRDLFIVEQAGVVKRATYRDGRWRKRRVFLDLRAVVLDPVKSHFEQGLLGLAFHPDHEMNGRLYVAYTRRGGPSRHGDLVVAEYRSSSRGAADRASARVVLVVDKEAPSHNGGRLLFGPDGYLYIGVGDGEFPGDPNEVAQDRRSLLGKILRIDPIDPDGAGPRRYAIPRENPFVGRPGRDEIWSLGLRNPWGFSIDRRTGDLWIGDPGEARREEIDLAQAGADGRGAGRAANFGWDDCEGSLEFEAGEGDADDACEQHRVPVFEYPHAPDACSVIGGLVHRGPGAVDWRGLYVAGDHCGRVFVLSPAGRLRLSGATDQRITSFGTDAAGRILATSLDGGIHRVRLQGPRP